MLHGLWGLDLDLASLRGWEVGDPGAILASPFWPAPCLCATGDNLGWGKKLMGLDGDHPSAFALACCCAAFARSLACVPGPNASSIAVGDLSEEALAGRLPAWYAGSGGVLGAGFNASGGVPGTVLGTVLMGTSPGAPGNLGIAKSGVPGAGPMRRGLATGRFCWRV